MTFKNNEVMIKKLAGIGHLIRLLRVNKLKMSQQAVADVLGVSISIISKAESGQSRYSTLSNLLAVIELFPAEERIEITSLLGVVINNGYEVTPELIGLRKDAPTDMFKPFLEMHKTAAKEREEKATAAKANIPVVKNIFGE